MSSHRFWRVNDQQKSLKLAQCDTHVAAELVQNASMHVESMLEKVTIREYENCGVYEFFVQATWRTSEVG